MFVQQFDLKFILTLTCEFGSRDAAQENKKTQQTTIIVHVKHNLVSRSSSLY